MLYIPNPTRGCALKKSNPILIIFILVLVLASISPLPVKLAKKPSIREPRTLYRKGLFKDTYPIKINKRPINPNLVNLFLSLFNKLKKHILKTNINKAFLEPIKIVIKTNNNKLKT